MIEPADLIRLYRLGVHHLHVQLGETTLDQSDPYLAFAEWYAEATKFEPDVPNALQLATVGADGHPAVRTVLMKALSPAEGLQFFTNLGSRKAQELAGNAHAAAVFHWKSLARQVIIEGPVRRVDDAIADAYFATRPRGSQIGAWASLQSQFLPTRADLERRNADHEARFRDQAVPRPPNWSGFTVTPTRWEFWQGRTDRLHDRWEFVSAPEGWRKGSLYP